MIWLLWCSFEEIVESSCRQHGVHLLQFFDVRRVKGLLFCKPKQRRFVPAFFGEQKPSDYDEVCA
jgi:hypothetical protein